MAISSIISFGFGNGTFSPGVAKLPTLGYAQTNVAVPTVPGAEVGLIGEDVHYTLAGERMHYRILHAAKLHYGVDEE